MRILSLDSAGNSCAVCVWHDGRVLAEIEEGMERGQDQRLMPLVLATLEKAGVGFESLDRIAVVRGPGSFTGLRIGLAAARGVGFAANKPVIGIDRFAIYRAQIKTPDKNLLVIVNSKRKELFCRFYPAKGEAEEPVMMTSNHIADFLIAQKETIVTGDLALEGTRNYEAAKEKDVVICAQLASHATASDPAFLPRPLYIRAPDVTFPKPHPHEDGHEAVSIRAIDVATAPLLAKLHAESFGPACWNLQQFESSLALQTSQGWVAYDKGAPLGFILCQMTEDAEILTFCVNPSSRRQGIGGQLLEKAIDAARARASKTLFLEVAADNHAAHTLYQKHSFRVLGRRSNYYQREAVQMDAVMLALPLGSP